MIWVSWAFVMIACVASGTYLVVTEHYGWAWIPFLIACAIPLKSKGD